MKGSTYLSAGAEGWSMTVMVGVVAHSQPWPGTSLRAEDAGPASRACSLLSHTFCTRSIFHAQLPHEPLTHLG